MSPSTPAPGIAHVHGTGGVGGDKLHHHLLAPALVTLSVEGPSASISASTSPYHLAPSRKFRKPGPAISTEAKRLSVKVHVVHHRLGDGPGAIFMALAPAMAKEEA